LVEDGAIGQGSTPEEFSVFLKGEVARWAEVIQQAKVPLQ
jgi:hypothetical protein